MVKKISKVFLFGLVFGPISACATWTVPLSSHTLVSGSESKDVVWVLESGKKIYRCTNAAEGPLCVPVRMPQ